MPNREVEALCADLRRGAHLSDEQMLDVARVLRTWPAFTIKRAALHLLRVERTGAALALLTCGEPVPVVRERLMLRFGVSRRSAYRCVAEALDLGRRS